MEPSTLRFTILQLLDQHERTGSNDYLNDSIMASRLDVPLADVQRQLVILEHRSQVLLASAFGPSHAARLAPEGMEALEALS